jgi:7-cyano-7-deazaguanine synthase
MKNRKAIVLVSGGMDSLYLCDFAARNNDEIYFLHINYGQRTENRELASFHRICDYFQPTGSKVLDIGFISQIGGNSLTDSRLFIPKNRAESETIPNTYVPFRNGIFVSIAVAWGEVISATHIYIGAIEVDGSGYPDCRGAFYESLERTINLGTSNCQELKIETPLINLTKAEIVRLGLSRNLPFDITWSCYESNETVCGTCDSCILRIAAFAKNGVVE